MLVHNENEILNLFEAINNAGIECILIKNICNELPDKLPLDKDIEKKKKKNERKAFRSFIKEQGGIEMIHPYGALTGYQTLYGINFPIMYILPSQLMIDVTDTLCVKCLNINAWIPLDKKINSSIWNDKIWNNNLGCWQMDEKNLICYLIARCIFDKHKFSVNYISEIRQRKYLLDDTEVIEKLQSVFFDFTQKLINLIKKEEFDNILNLYIGYSNY